MKGNFISFICFTLVLFWIIYMALAFYVGIPYVGICQSLGYERVNLDLKLSPTCVKEYRLPLDNQ